MQVNVIERTGKHEGGWELKITEGSKLTTRYIIPINGLFYAINPFALEQSPVFSSYVEAYHHLISQVDFVQ